VFILYAVLIGLVLGFVLGGRLSGLAVVDFHWPWLAIGGFLVQLVLFSDAVRQGVGDLGPSLYVASTAAVLIAVIRNVRIPGMALVALGAGSNFVAIVANGGYMPASEAAFTALGGALNPGYTNSAIVPDPAVQPLTDVYALPGWLPYANVFSIGDVLIALGVVVVIVSAMRAGRVHPVAAETAETAETAAAPEPASRPAVDAPAAAPAVQAPASAPTTRRRSFRDSRFLPPNRKRS
jgi:uncharacterized protein DUF5317